MARHHHPHEHLNPLIDLLAQRHHDASNAPPVVHNEAGLPVMSHRPPDRTEIRVRVRILKYEGVHPGPNGFHEIAEAVFEGTPLAVGQAQMIDTHNIHLAMNVHSDRDPHGLPDEVELRENDVIEIQGEYIPAKHANDRNAHGPAAVIHFTHSPAGYVVISQQRYK
jgi:hypothetical protein